VTPLQGVGQHAEGALPGAVQQVEGTLHLLPVRQVEEGVGDGFRVTPLQHVLRRQNHWLHFQQVLLTHRQKNHIEEQKSDLAFKWLQYTSNIENSTMHEFILLYFHIGTLMSEPGFCQLIIRCN